MLILLAFISDPCNCSEIHIKLVYLIPCGLFSSTHNHHRRRHVTRPPVCLKIDW